MYCVIPFAGYPGEGKYVSAEDTEVAAIAQNWILTAKGHMIFFLRFRVFCILILMVVTQLYLFAKIHELYTKDGKLMVILVLIVFLEGYRAIRKCPFFFWITAAGCIKYPMTFRDVLLGASLLLLETLPLPSWKLHVYGTLK